MEDVIALPTYNDAQLSAIVQEVTDFVHVSHDHFGAIASPISDSRREVMAPFFPTSLLSSARLFMGGLGTVTDPPFAARARARGFANMPNYSHLGEITFGNVIVLQTRISDRLLFHSLVHCVQYALLGIEEYVARYIHQFVRTGIHVLVPFEEHAFRLDHRFANSPQDVFSVESEVRQMIATNKY